MVTKKAEKKSEEKKELPKPKSEKIEELIKEIAKTENVPAKIGLLLRDKHGISGTRTLLNKKLLQILKSMKISYKTEKEIVEERISKLKLHLEKNKHDYTASRALTKSLWALRNISVK